MTPQRESAVVRMHREMARRGARRRLYIREAADLLGRRMSTLRKWEQVGVLPEHLRSHRGWRGWRYWTHEQIVGIRLWIKDTDRRPGKGLPHYDPTEEQIKRAIDAMRTPRRPRLARGNAMQEG